MTQLNCFLHSLFDSLMDDSTLFRNHDEILSWNFRNASLDYQRAQMVISNISTVLHNRQSTMQQCILQIGCCQVQFELFTNLEEIFHSIHSSCQKPLG